MNLASTRWTWIYSWTKVSDVDKSHVVIVKPSIQVVKFDANSNDRDWVRGNDTQTINSWNNAVFWISVKNNWSEDLKNIVLSDPLAWACDSNGSAVNLSGKNFKNELGKLVAITFSGAGNPNDNILQVGEIFSYTCERSNVTSDFTIWIFGIK